MDLVNSIFSQQWLWGAVVGAGLTYLGQWRAHCVQQNEEQHVAAMQIASGLRQWMALSERMIDDINSHGGSAHYEIPEFPFEKSLGQVSKLDRKMAIAVLELIHNKNDRNIEIEVAIEYGNALEDKAADITHRRIARTYLEAEPIYRSLANNIGWKTSPFADEQVARMQEEVERLEESERIQRESTAQLFSELTERADRQS
jgi:hypothetical protein